MENENSEFAEFADVVSLLRQKPVDVSPEKPSPMVWDNIQAAIASERDLESSELSGSVRREASFIQRRFRVLAAVAAAVVALAGVGLFVVSQQASRSASLVALGDYAGGDAAATLDGSELALEIADLQAPTEHYYELWLLRTDPNDPDVVQDLRSLGKFESGATYSVPEDLDTSLFDVVDISLELDDGDASHSGDSILRGQLS